MAWFKDACSLYAVTMETDCAEGGPEFSRGLIERYYGSERAGKVHHFMTNIFIPHMRQIGVMKPARAR